MQTKTQQDSNRIILTISVIIFGIGLRFLAATRGHNYDFDSFLIVVKIISHGGNVYAETARYNYGPVWFNLLHLMYNISLENEIVFRYLLTGFLSLVDFGIFIILFKKFGNNAAYIFFLNPISIIITGYHNQFDNLAILLALSSVLLIGNDFDKPINTRRKYLGLFALGLSIATKHLFFLYPFWIAVKQKGVAWKAAVMLIPTIIFLLSFAPYWNTGKLGIIKNVLMYQSLGNEFFYRLLIPPVLQLILTSKGIWVLLLIAFGLFFKKKSLMESLLFYTCVLVASSPSITNQYLAIVIPFIAVNTSPFAFIYTILGTVHLFVDHDGLHFTDLLEGFSITREVYYATMMLLLCSAFTWTVSRQQIIALSKSLFREIKAQIEIR